MNHEHHDHDHDDHDFDLYDLEDTSDFVLDLDDALQAELEGTAWEAQVKALNENTTLEERARLYQQLRAAGAVPEEAGFFLVAWALESIAEERVDELYDRQYAGRFEKLAEEHGLDEEMLAVMDKDELPADYRALELELAQAIDALTTATFQSFGEHKMSSLYTTDPDEFDRRYDEGYAFFFGEIEGYQSDLGEQDLQD